MESNSNHSTSQGTNSAGNTVSDSSKEIMDFYTKQFSAVGDFYKNMFAPFSNGNKVSNSYSDFSSGFFNNNFPIGFTMPFSGLNNNSANPFLAMFDKFYKQMLEYNTSTFTKLAFGIGGTTDLSETNKKYQDMINVQLETYNSVLKTINESFTKHFYYSIENNKKAMEEMNSQFHLIANQSRLFWSDLIASNQVKANSKEKVEKDSISPEIKKRTAVPATELSDHKV